MRKLTQYQQINMISFRVNSEQKETLKKLKSKYKIKIADFIRCAIKEKIKRDYPILINKIDKNKCPF